MNEREQRLAEIYSYYLDERRQDDLSETFTEWLTTSMYGKELTEIIGECFDAVVASMYAVLPVVTAESEGSADDNR